MYTDPKDWSPVQLRLLRHYCASSTLAAARVFFKQRDFRKLIVSRHHRIIAQTLDRVFAGEITRLIINIPPGYTKTELAVLAFSLRGFLQNPGARFIHASYSDDLAARNSALIKHSISNPMFQALQPLQTTLATKYWTTDKGGQFLSAPSGGQITGFRAGYMDDAEFSGALIIDDPIKPEDAFSKTKRENINRNFDATFRSRLALESVPIIIIMQRLHQNDMTGYLLGGGGGHAGERWHHLIIPARITGPQQYPADRYPYGIPVEYDLPVGPLWPYKHNDQALDTLAARSSYTWAGQYQQDPSDPAARVFHRDWIPRWEWSEGFDRRRGLLRERIEGKTVEVRIDRLEIYADTAMKTGESNDYSVFQLWGRGTNDKIYLIDQLRGRWEAPELMRQMLDFLRRWSPVGNMYSPTAIKIEDKASGIGLIQSLNEEIRRGAVVAPLVRGIPRGTDKVTRARIAAPFVERGQVVVPDSAPWTETFLQELESFTELGTHEWDDQVDPMLDAVADNFVSAASVDYATVI